MSNNCVNIAQEINFFETIFMLLRVQPTQEIYFNCTKYYVTSTSASDKYKGNTIKNSCNEIYPRLFNKGLPTKDCYSLAPEMCNNYYYIIA